MTHQAATREKKMSKQVGRAKLSIKRHCSQLLSVTFQVKCYIGVGPEREEVARIKVGGYFGETALLHNLPTKVI